MVKARILVQGIVQGVGFRPTVYRLARKMDMPGFVRNLGNVVEIVLEGKKEEIKKFVECLDSNKPPISKISSLKIEWFEDTSHDYNNFEIRTSSSDFSGSSVIPSDVATCNPCLDEIKQPKNRRYGYPFTACTDCGPRFTVIKSIPYDRERTSMEKFPLCLSCETEYNDPEDRRYHAEATCCPDCGPSVYLYKKKILKVDDPIKKAASLLDKGKILAIKGIGGTHLVCTVNQDKVVKELRKRLGRFSQPFACMSPDIETIKTFAQVSPLEEQTLKSRRRPIVVLKKNERYYLAPSVAPDLHNIGVMLPYSGLHHVLFDHSSQAAYVMTSANRPGEPMLTINQEIIEKLENVADYFLLHDREIINRCDDSVVRFRGDDMAFIRRSRGYAPEPYDLSSISQDLKVLALGPEIDVTFSLLKDGRCYLSQHIGDTSKYATYQYLQEAVDYLMKITKTEEVDIIACDMHPQFFTTQLAEKLSEENSCPVFPVQHHHAHGVALAVDVDESEMICIAADGVGYGADGTAWGGEVLHIHEERFERLGSLMPQNMAGGDLCTRYPARMLFSILQNQYNENYLLELMKKDYKHFFPRGEVEIDILNHQLARKINVGITTSTGRVLDAISVALGICGERTYEGECAMKLESVAFQGEEKFQIPFKIKKDDGRDVLDTSFLLKEVMEKIKEGEKRENIAFAAQKSLSQGLAALGIKAAEKKRIDIIGGSGGVFYNEAISLTIKKYVESRGFKFVQHQTTCAGDGSVSLGQAAIAAYKFEK